MYRSAIGLSLLVTLASCFGGRAAENTNQGVSLTDPADSGQGALQLRFDDRYRFPEEVIRVDTIGIVSRQTGTDMPDAEVLTVHTQDPCLVTASGCGEAKVETADGSVYTVSVTAAPIAMILMAGQSNVEGRPAIADRIDRYRAEQVLCPEGTAYISYGPSDEYGQDMYREVAWYADEEQIGALTVENAHRFIPQSLFDNTQNDIYCKTNRLSDAPDAGGKGGCDAAFAYRWYQLTGEKVWLINAAHHGCRIGTWDPAEEEHKNYDEGIAMFQEAERVLSEEIRAGHYQLARKGVLWDQGENNMKTGSAPYFRSLRSVADGLWKGMDGSGIEGMEMEPSFFGIMIVRSGDMDTASPADFTLTGPRRAQYYATSQEGDPKMFLASQAREEWTTDQAVRDYFVSRYGTQEAFRSAYPTLADDLIMPSTIDEVRGNVHYSQLAYNEIGLDAAENLCYELGYVQPPAPQDIKIMIVTEDGMTDRAGTTLQMTGKKLPLAVKVFPTWLSKELSVDAGSNGKYKNGNLRAKGDGPIELTATVRGQTATVLVENASPEKSKQIVPEDPGQEQVTEAVSEKAEERPADHSDEKAEERPADLSEPETGKEQASSRIDALIAGMTTEEKVAQMFMVTPETLTQTWGVTAAGPQTSASFAEIPVGGLIYMGDNIQSWEQVQDMLSSTQEISMRRIGLPAFLAVDEEGGRVCRVSGRLDQVPYIPDMAYVGSTYDTEYAFDTGCTIGSYLSQLGFNVNLAPVADLLTNPENTVIGDRSLGSDPAMAGDMIASLVDGMHSGGVCTTLKHFPGHGNTSEDSHSGLAVSYKTLKELESCEFVPFEKGIEAGAEFIMTGHIALPNVTGDYTPATLSLTILTDILRNRLGFEGIIITDALEMGAITETYGSGEAAVYAVRAGADLLLEPADFRTAYYAVLSAVSEGRISEERLNESMRRILKVKLDMMWDPIENPIASSVAQTEKDAGLSEETLPAEVEQGGEQSLPDVQTTDLTGESGQQADPEGLVGE